MFEPKQTFNAETELAFDMGRFYDDPLGFVMYAYPWSTDPALQVVELQSPWNLIYDSKYGPDKWACEMLDAIGAQVREHAFDGVHAVDAIREAISSGHGIGKSALVAWLVDWIMSTRPNCHGTVTATTSDQLSSKTWAEIAKWTKKCITSHWFDVTTGKGAMRMKHKQFPESWFCAAQTCQEENSEAFAGQHAVDSTSFYIFDEASGVPPKIWEVSEGGLTDGEPMWFAFGNPTRNTGTFAECFGKSRHRWNNRHIDSRSVQITNKKVIQEWIDDNGIDSDFVKIRVRGVFPSASSQQFIGRAEVDAAQQRPLLPERFVGRTCAVGVDVARFGDDNSVIRTRVGRDARSIPAKKFRGLDTVQLAARVSAHLAELRLLGLNPVLFVDGGGVGGGVVDQLRLLKHDVIEVNFGSSAVDSRRYKNKRAEMWGALKEWLPIGCLDNDEMLATDLTNVEYSFTLAEQILLQSKKEMKALGLPSPDDADALCLTFAMPVPDHAPPPSTDSGAQRAKRGDYDPLETF
jgi:hypothetical protein